MTVVPAVVAGVEEIVVCTPPQKDGTVPAPVLYAARRAGATHVARTGGAQAVAAMAYGTESIPAVDRIVGPGNVYVTEAKRQVAGFVGIDGLAGPSDGEQLRRTHALTPAQPLLLSVGRIERNKGFQVLVQALRRLGPSAGVAGAGAPGSSGRKAGSSTVPLARSSAR